MGSLNPVVVAGGAPPRAATTSPTGSWRRSRLRRAALHEARPRVRPRRRRGGAFARRRGGAVDAGRRGAAGRGLRDAFARRSSGSPRRRLRPPDARRSAGRFPAAAGPARGARDRPPGGLPRWRSTSVRPSCCSATRSRRAPGGARTRRRPAHCSIHASPTRAELIGRSPSARGARRPRPLRRLPDRRRRHLAMQHGGPWPATVRRRHVGRHDGDRPLPAPGRVAERARLAAAAGAPRRQPARPLAPRGRRADPRTSLSTGCSTLSARFTA